MGRYPDKTVAEVFSSNRPYFDQLLHKNIKFRQRYADAYQQWVKHQEDVWNDHGQLYLNRILLAIELMGEDRIEKLFKQLIKVMNEEWPTQKFPEDLGYKTTLNGELNGLEGYGQQLKRVQLFWDRIAIPEAR